MSSSAISGVITLLHTACGAGILAMPYAFRPFGLVLGVILIVFCGLCSCMGLYLQSYVSQYAPSRHASFFSLAQLTYPQLSVVFDGAIAIKCFGVGVSYLIVVGDILPQIAGTFTTHSWLLSREFHITAIMALVVGPLCFMKKLDSLRYTSSVAMSAVGYLCVLIVVHYFLPDTAINNSKGEVSIGIPTNIDASKIRSFPIFVFAYTCHHNMFSIINEQIDPSLKNLKKIVTTAVMLAMSLYIVIGGLGYMTFGSNTPGNIITSYPNSGSTTIGRIAISLLVILAFPLQCHPARASIHHIIQYFKIKNTKPVSLEPQDQENNSLLHSDLHHLSDDERIEENIAAVPPSPTFEGKDFILITTTILLSSYVLALSVKSLAKVLSIVGATGSTSISFILPGIFGFQLIASEYSNKDSIPRNELFLKYLALILSIWGLIVMITCLFASLFLGASH